MNGAFLKLHDSPPSYWLNIPVEGLSEPERRRMELLSVAWGIGFQWVFKLKWGIRNPDFKHRQKIPRAFRPFGEHLTALLELAIQSHPLAPQGRFINALSWFEMCAQEMTRWDMAAVLENRAEGKRSHAEFVRDQIAMAADYRNPLDAKTEPAAHSLFEAAIRMAVRSDEFDKQYWKPFLESWRTWVTAKNSPRFMSLVHDERRIYRLGKGGSKMALK